MSTLKLITAPSVYVIGRQSIDEAELQRFLDANDVGGWKTDTDVAAERLVEVAGRLCYHSYGSPRPGGNKAYIDHILDVQHGSVCEHAVWTILLTGISRSCGRELLRHRHLSPSELSQRYVDCSDVAFVVPPALLRYRQGWLDKQHREWHVFESWKHQRQENLSDYIDLVNVLTADAPTDIPPTDRRKWARQAARSVLPECTETRIVFTGNARAFRNLIELRASRHADAEIRRLAGAIWEVLVKESPALFGDYERVALAGDDFELRTRNRKV